METAEERLQKTALTELETSVETSLEPMKVFEIFSREYREGIEAQRERAHFITLSYLCKAPKDYSIPADKSQNWGNWIAEMVFGFTGKSVTCSGLLPEKLG